MLTADLLRSHFERGLTYDEYVATGSAAQRESWAKALERIHLAPDQRALVGGFTRRMPVLVSSGIWCGDCSAQVPMLARIAQASPSVDLRIVDRDKHADLAERIKICGGRRVPTAIFMAEDHEFIGLMGDRTLSRYRAVAAKHLGAACPLPGAETPPDEVAATLRDWVDEFERAHLILRLSARLRQKHGD